MTIRALIGYHLLASIPRLPTHFRHSWSVLLQVGPYRRFFRSCALETLAYVGMGHSPCSACVLERRERAKSQQWAQSPRPDFSCVQIVFIFIQVLIFNVVSL